MHRQIACLRWMSSCMQCHTVYPKKYAHGFVVLCFVVVMQSFIMNSHEVFVHIHQGCFAGTGAIVRLPQCQWSKPDGYGIISRCITTTKRSKAKTACIFLGIYCILHSIGGLPRTGTCRLLLNITLSKFAPFNDVSFIMATNAHLVATSSSNRLNIWLKHCLGALCLQRAG